MTSDLRRSEEEARLRAKRTLSDKRHIAREWLEELQDRLRVATEDEAPDITRKLHSAHASLAAIESELTAFEPSSSHVMTASELGIFTYDLDASKETPGQADGTSGGSDDAHSTKLMSKGSVGGRKTPRKAARWGWSRPRPGGDPRPAFRRGTSQEEARAVIYYWWERAGEAPDLTKPVRPLALAHSTVGDRDRRAVLAVFMKAFVQGRTKFSLGDRDAARLAGLPVSTFRDARRMLSAEGFWFTYEGVPRKWVNGRRVAGTYHVRENRIPNDPRVSEGAS